MILKQIHNISLVLLLICSSCIDTKVDSIFINLEHAESSINYSSIFERVEYINLDAGEECLLSGIKKIYFVKSGNGFIVYKIDAIVVSIVIVNFIF